MVNGCGLACVQERELELQKEQRRQEENDKLRQEFAQHANAFHQWLQETRWESSQAEQHRQPVGLAHTLGTRPCQQGCRDPLP